MKTNLLLLFCLFLAKITFAQAPKVQDSTTMCTIEFSYIDTTDRNWGEVSHLKRTYLTKNICIDSITYSEISFTGKVSIDTFKIENNEWFYLHMGTYYLLFSEEKFKKGEVTKYFSRKDNNPVIFGTMIYRPEQFYFNYKPSQIIQHSYLGICYVFWVEENRELGSTYPIEVYFSPKYGLVGFGSTIVSEIKTTNCK
jgi:hypothetical protein